MYYFYNSFSKFGSFYISVLSIMPIMGTELWHTIN